MSLRARRQRRSVYEATSVALTQTRRRQDPALWTRFCRSPPVGARRVYLHAQAAIPRRVKRSFFDAALLETSRGLVHSSEMVYLSFHHAVAVKSTSTMQEEKLVERTGY